MIGGVTRHILPHLPGVPHLHVNRPLNPLEQSVTDINIRTFYQFFGVKAFQYFDTVYQNILRDKQNTPERKKFEIKQPMRFSYCSCFFFKLSLYANDVCD